MAVAYGNEENPCSIGCRARRRPQNNPELGNREKNAERKTERKNQAFDADSWQITTMNISLRYIPKLLMLSPVRISRKRPISPPYWRSNQQISIHPETLGAKIRGRRLELRLLQSFVAKQIGVSTASISSWERGVTAPATDLNVEQLTERIELLTRQINDLPLDSGPSPLALRLDVLQADLRAAREELKRR